MMSLVVAADPIPLITDQYGVVRVRGTRIPLDTVIAAYQAGTLPEEIVDQYSTLQLADVYGIISYYLNHRDEVEQYLQERQRRADELQAEIEARSDPRGIRERLLARQAKRLPE